MSAVISSDGKYRYRLGREFCLNGEGSVCFVMLNPSTADAEQDDPTIRRCIGFAKRFGAERLDVVNLFAYRATDPSALRSLSKSDAVGPENDMHILDAVMRSKRVVCAWGNHGILHGRAKEVMRLIGGVLTPMALKVSKSGQPAHPLYLKADIQPVMFTGKQTMTAPDIEAVRACADSF